MAPREIDFPYYSLTDGFHSTLMLVSDSPNPIDLTIGIRSLLGQMLTTTETIQPQQKLAIDLASTIAKLGQDSTGAFAEGSVAVYFMGTIMPVAGQMTVTNPALSLTHQVDMVENDPGRSDIPAVLNGAWWGLGGGNAAQVFVSNTSDSAQMAQVYLDFAGKRRAIKKPLTFVPYETKVLDIAQLLASIGVDPADAPAGGITIIQAGPHPALIAGGKITDSATGFSSTIDFPDPQLQLASALHASGLPIGVPTKDSPFAGGGEFIPHVVVRNLLATPQTVTITLEYPVPAPPSTETGAAPSPPPVGALLAAPSGKPRIIIRRPPLPGDKDLHPEWGAGTGSTTGSTIVASFSVAAYSTTDYSLGPAVNELPLPLPFCSIRIQYSGAPGSMIADVSSVEQASNMVVDAKAENEGNGWDGSGANPWHVDKDTDSVLFLTNMSDQATHIGFEITASGIHYYLTELKLNPHETRAINIRALRDAQLADFKGHKIPVTATDGSINWIRLDDVPVMGRLMVINHAAGMAISYDCYPAPCPSSFEGLVITSSLSDILIGNSAQFTATAYYWDCNGNETWSDATDVATWSSDDPSVATAGSDGVVTAGAGGTADVTADMTDAQYPNCAQGECKPEPAEYSSSEPVTVQVPTSLSIVSGTSSTTSKSQCSTSFGTGCGASRTFSYQVLDQNGDPIQESGIEVWDSITVNQQANGLKMGQPNTTCTGKSGGTNGGPCTVTTNSSGQFREELSVCSTVCWNGSSCVTGASSTATQTPHANQYTLNAVTLTYECNQVLVNGG